tara:strand:- start:840 stop:1184 length:345 start_codon:yes stop_codon:yes gene_type:complete
MSETIQPNDVVMVLRPYIDEEGDWDGSFHILNSIHGPVTMDKSDVESLMGLCVLTSSVIQFMDDDPTIAEAIMNNFSENYKHTDADMKQAVNRMFEEDEPAGLTFESKTIGGMQ